MVGSGKKVYLPVVSQKENGDGSTTIVDNSEENIYGGYDEEEVCQEIEDQLGVLPVRFGYCPKDMELEQYRITEEKDTVQLEAMSMDIPIYEYSDDYENWYLQSSFEYLNTYYSISGMLNEQEFKKILENIYVKNV